MVENMHDDPSIDEFADEELSDLFSAFDGVSASDALKEKALGAIAVAAGAATAQAAAQPASTAAAGPVKASAGGKAAKTVKAARNPFRALRIASIAACLSVAVIGGVAYGMPTSHVVLSQAGAVVELNINRFGVVVSASSDDEAGRAIVEAGGLVNAPYADAFARVATAMGDASTISVLVDSGDPAQRELLESGGASLFTGLADGHAGAGAREGGGTEAKSGQQDANQGDENPDDGQPELQRSADDQEAPSQSLESTEAPAQEGDYQRDYQQYYPGAVDEQPTESAPSEDEGDSSELEDPGESADWGDAVIAGEEPGNPDVDPEAEGVSEYVISEEPPQSGELSHPQLPDGVGAVLENGDALYDWVTWSPDSSGESTWEPWKPGDTGDGSWEWGSWGSDDAGKEGDSGSDNGDAVGEPDADSCELQLPGFSSQGPDGE